MKQFMLFLFLLIIFSTILSGQDRYPRPLEKVDITKIWHSTPGIIPENTMESDPIVADIINQTNLDSLVSFVRILSGEEAVWIGNSEVIIQNRGGSGGGLAADYLIQKLESYNLEVYDQVYSSTGRNVYAVQEGYLYPEKQFIICAHYDAVDVYCADDNASGVAAVIEAARILSKYNFKYTLIYALWDEEEAGLVGSNYYASQAASNQDQIQGVLNMDMLAWDGNDDNLLDIHSQNTGNSNNIANLMVFINWLYELQLNPVIYNPGTWQSDHSSFWNYGYGAVLLIEAYYGGDLNPYYHSVDDRVDKFNQPYFHNLCKLSMGTISTLIEITTDTLLASVIPDYGYQTYPASIQIKGVNTHFEEGLGTQQVWLSMDQETISVDSFVVTSNTIINAYFQIPATASLGMWDVNVESSIDGILTKEDCFNILPPPAIIVVNPDSFFVDISAGTTTTRTLTISNQGETNLYFNIIGGFSFNNFALQFDGVDDYVDIINLYPLKNVSVNSITFEGWINILSATGDRQQFVEGLTNNGEFLLESFTSNDMYFIINQYGVSLDSIQWGNWHHIAATYDGYTQKIFLDGILKNSVAWSDQFTITTGIRLGKDYELDIQYLKGIIDEVRIWNIARSQGDIQEFMNRQLTGTENGLVGYWQFDEGEGDVAYDRTVNGNHGSLQNGVNWINSSAPIAPGWVFINVDSGMCLPHSSTDIEILFDATDLDSGDYYATLIINSSDPFNPSVIIPVHLIVAPVVGVENELNIPTVYELFQNYPNPFNPITTIKYSVPELSKVKLTLFNLLGEEVATLVNEEKLAGNYSVEFNAASLPSGVYFYRLQAGSFVETKKMILMK
jgi:hypothetical protein